MTTKQTNTADDIRNSQEHETEFKCDECDDAVVALCIECKLYLCQDCNKVHSKKNKTHHIVSTSSITKEGSAGRVENTASEHRNVKHISSDEEMSQNLSKATNSHTSEVMDLPSTVYCRQNVEFKIITKDSKGKNCSTGGAQVSVQLKSFTGDITAGEVRDNNDGSYMASFVAEQVGEAKLSVSINGEQIKGSPYSIVVGRNYQAIDKPAKIVNDEMGRPWGVAFGRNGLWAVADSLKHCVHIFDDKDQLVRTFGCSGSDNGQFRYPRGVAFDSHNHLYVVDYGNHRVQKFETTGNYLLQFGSEGGCDGQLQGPCGVTVHNDKVYISDYSNSRISVFQTNGKFCISFGSDQLGSPSDVAVCGNSYLLVVDDNGCCIYIFTLDGHYVGKFGTPGSGRNQLNGPCGITTDLNGFIIVADTYNSRISIFNEDNQCICSFGSYGYDLGQFYRPHGIAVSPNGNIYVGDTENSNKKIQIF